MFLIGFFSCAFLFFSLFITNYEIPFKDGFMFFNSSNYVSDAPSDWVNEKDITVFEDMIILKIPNSSISNYAPTGSMKPLFDEGANGIRIIPKSEGSIKVGDIVSFRKEDKLIVHRVVDKGIDEKGVYFITRGDNNDLDDGKIRFDEIEFITVGVIW